MGRFTVEKTLG